MEILNVVQGTKEWLEARKGIITGSRLKAVSSAPSTATYKTLMEELIAEDLAPLPEAYQNDAMIRGNMLEPIAREEYEKRRGCKVEEVGFCKHDTMKFLGLSPDGFIEIDGKYKKAIEIKCPGAKNHLKYIMDGKIPDDYEYQILTYFIVNEDLLEIDFITFNPDIYLEKLRMFIITVTRKDYEKKIQEMIEKLHVFKQVWESKILLLTK